MRFSEKKELFAKNTILDGSNYSNLIEQLRTNGYRDVEMPDENDLVLYFYEMKLAHMGIFCSDGRVISKWGYNCPDVVRHQIFDVPRPHGNTVKFMRKSAAQFGWENS